MRILIVDDNPTLCDLLLRSLAAPGDAVSIAMSVHEADQRISAEAPFDVVVLDLALPDGWGADWCRRQRARGMQSMVLTLTANSDLDRRLDAFDAGVDDFLAKPFAVAELRARVRALGRRRVETARRTLGGGSVVVDFGARVASRDARRVTLTAREWSVLDRLAAGDGRVVSREQMLTDVWGTPSDANRASLDVIVGRIRKKLGAGLIRTVRGDGYVLEG